MSIVNIGNQYTMTATVFGRVISVSASTLEGVKEAFEYELFLVELSEEVAA